MVHGRAEGARRRPGIPKQERWGTDAERRRDLAEAKVAQLGGEPLVDEDVGRLDVAVQHDALGARGAVQEVQAAHGVRQDREALAPAEGAELLEERMLHVYLVGGRRGGCAGCRLGAAREAEELLEVAHLPPRAHPRSGAHTRARAHTGRDMDASVSHTWSRTLGLLLGLSVRPCSRARCSYNPALDQQSKATLKEAAAKYSPTLHLDL